MKVKFKKLHEEAVTPTYGTVGSAGLDLTAISKEKVYNTDGTLQYITYDTGLAIQVPLGYVGMIFPRSSISNKNMSLSNAVGVLDSDFTGSITFRFRSLSSDGSGEYEVGERIGQLVVVSIPSVELVEVEELNQTERGSNGYGSTNLKIERSQAW